MQGRFFSPIGYSAIAFLAGGAFCWALWATSLGAQQRQTLSAPSKANSARSNTATSGRPAKKRRSMVTPEREAAAMTFVRRHHPELAEVLSTLKTKSRREYQLAIRQLFRTSEKLAQTRERDYERYELDLALWKARSRAQLLAARLKVTNLPADSRLRDQLRRTLQEQLDIQEKIVRRNRQAAQLRLERLDKQLERLTTNREKIVRRQMKQLLSTKNNRTLPVNRPSPRKAQKNTGSQKGADG